MFQIKVKKLRGPDKTVTREQKYLDDYNQTTPIGRVKLGKYFFYYRDLGKKYYVPYDYIERAFCRVSTVQPDDSPAIDYYRLILVHDNKEFANLIFNEREENLVDSILEYLPSRNENIKIGYVPPADGIEKPRFK